MGALDAARGGLGGHAYGLGAISAGAIKRPGGGPSALRFGSLRGYSWRRSVALPSGFVLPAAVGGTPPYTYTASPRPGGVAFAAATRTLSGTPIAAGTTTVTYAATDSADTPATVTGEFEFEIVATNARLTSQDYGARRLGLETLPAPFKLWLFRGTVNVLSADITIFDRRVGQTAVGNLIDDEGNNLAGDALTEALTVTNSAGLSMLIDRIVNLNTSDRMQLRESDSAIHMRAFLDDAWGTGPRPSIYIRIANETMEAEYDRAFGSNYEFRDGSGYDTFLRTMDSGVVALLAVAPPSP